MILCSENEETKIKISDLSPGENLIFRLLIWQYIFAYKKFTPAEKCVILFDEPDAHLHPSAVKTLLDNLKNLCRLGVQIILTTHNPTTVSFVERENIFLLERNNDKLSIRRGVTELDIYQELTSRLVSIAAPSRKIFIEGDDAPFYNVIYTFLKDSYITRGHFQLNFIAMPNKKCRNKANIVKLIENFDPHPSCDYDEIHSFHGITDDDNDRLFKDPQPCLKNLFALKRYSKENYVFDPINFYFYVRSLRIRNKAINDYLYDVERKADQDIKDKSLKEIYKELNQASVRKETNELQKMQKFLQLIINSLKEQFLRHLFPKNNRAAFFTFNVTKAVLFEWILKTSSPALVQFKRSIIGPIRNKNEALTTKMNSIEVLRVKVQEGIKFVREELEKTQNELKSIINVDKKKEFSSNIASLKCYLTRMEALNPDSENFESDFLQTLETKLLMEFEPVFVFGIELSYPKLFTCLGGHELEYLFKKFFDIKCNKMVEAFSDMGIFVPNELISIFKNIDKNIIQLSDLTFLNLV